MKNVCVLSVCCLFELCLTIQITHQHPNLDKFDIYLFTPHNRAPLRNSACTFTWVSVHAPLHRSIFLKEFYCHCKSFERK